MYKRFLNLHNNNNYNYSSGSSSNNSSSSNSSSNSSSSSSNNTSSRSNDLKYKHVVIIDIDLHSKHHHQKCISSCLYEKINNIQRLFQHSSNSYHHMHNHEDHHNANKYDDNRHNYRKDNRSNNNNESITIDNLKFPFDNIDNMIFQRKISEFLTISYMNIDMHILKTPNTVVLDSCETNDFDSSGSSRSGSSSSSSRRSGRSINSNYSCKKDEITIGFIYCDEMMLLNEAYDYNEINRWIIDQATILNNKFIYNIILIIIGGSSSNSNNTLYIIQNVKDYITITIILSYYDSINNDHSSGYLDRSSCSNSSRSSSRSSCRSSSNSRSSHLYQNISCKGLYYDTKSWRYMKIYMNTYRKKKYSLYHNHAQQQEQEQQQQQQQQQQHNSHYSDEYHSNYKNNLNQEVGMIMMNFIKRNNKLHISSDVFVI